MSKAGFLRKIAGGTLLLTLLAGICTGVWAAEPVQPQAQQTKPTQYTVNYWVEKPNLFGDPGDPTLNPEDTMYYVLYMQEIKDGIAGQTVKLTDEDVDKYLRTPDKGRRFASFYVSEEAELAEDGSTQVNVYYARDLFTYEFDLLNDKAEMTVGDVTYYGGQLPRYSFRAKYEQTAIIPGMENGMLPTSSDPSQSGIYCSGWSMDQRTGETSMLTFSKTITESMLPTDDMPYEDLVFTFNAMWFNKPETSLLVCWYEELPEEVGQERERMTYNGKVYIHYPESDYECELPAGAKPEAASAPGLIYRTRLDADPTKEGIEGRTWQFIYDRDRFTVSFDSGGAGSIPAARDIMYQQNLGAAGPNWNEATTRTEGSTTYKFAGWHTSSGDFVGYRLSGMYMPSRDVRLTARWERG